MSARVFNFRQPDLWWLIRDFADAPEGEVVLGRQILQELSDLVEVADFGSHLRPRYEDECLHRNKTGWACDEHIGGPS